MNRGSRIDFSKDLDVNKILRELSQDSEFVDAPREKTWDLESSGLGVNAVTSSERGMLAAVLLCALGISIVGGAMIWALKILGG